MAIGLIDNYGNQKKILGYVEDLLSEERRDLHLWLNHKIEILDAVAAFYRLDLK